MNTPSSEPLKSKDIDDFIQSFASLPPNLIVVVGFTTFLRDLLSAVEIASRIGVAIASIDAKSRMQEAVAETARLGSYLRGENTTEAERLSLNDRYTALARDIDKIAEAVIANQDHLTVSALAPFDTCTSTDGCSAPEAIRLLTRTNHDGIENISALASSIVRRINL